MDRGADLFAAIGRRDTAGVMRLLAEGADVNQYTEDGRRPLVSAVRAGSSEIVRILLDAGAPVDGKAGGHGTALMAAVRQGDAGSAGLLLEAGADIRSYSCDSPLCAAFQACMLGRTEIARAMMDRVPALIGWDDGYGWTPLHYASAYGHGDLARILLDRGADMEAATDRGLTPLLASAARGRHGMALLLLDRGASIRAADREGRTALHLAADAETPDAGLMGLLLDRGADVDAWSADGKTALHLALRQRRRKRSRDGCSVLEPVPDAALEAVRLLVLRGADARIADGDGHDALRLALRFGHPDAAALLGGCGPWPLRDLELRLEGGRKPSGPLAPAWDRVASRVPDEGDAAGLLFLGEVLSAFSGARWRFSSAFYTRRDMFGCHRAVWGLASGGMTVVRDWESRIRDDWEGVDVLRDVLGIAGFPPGTELSWDGDFHPMEAKVRGADGRQEEAILAAARALFKAVEVSRECREPG